MDSNNIKLGVIGCGKMATAILKGSVKSGFVKPENIYVYDINEQSAGFLQGELLCNRCFGIEDLMKNTNTVLIATKPFAAQKVLNEMFHFYEGHVVMSILAGVKLQKYRDLIPDIKIARIMPNTPALVNCGISAIAGDTEAVGIARGIMRSCGGTAVVDESKMDIITALSGSGPAFYYKIIDLMARAAAKHGLDYKQALIFSAQTALGSARMITAGMGSVDELITNVTTPGGCTEVGNEVLLQSDLDAILDKTIKDTMERARELG